MTTFDFNRICFLFTFFGQAMADKLNCGAELRFYSDINCQGDPIEGWVLNGNGHNQNLNNKYGSPDAPAMRSIGWDKAAHTLICIGNADVSCAMTLGDEDPAYDSQCHSLEPGCSSSDCWSPFGVLYADYVSVNPERGYKDCQFSANW